MATVHIVPYGVIVEFDHSEVNRIVAAVGTASGLAGVLAAMGITGPATIILAIVSALLSLGAGVLSGCDRGNGIFLYVFWIPLVWCRHR
jgi:hypothetical protein